MAVAEMTNAGWTVSVLSTVGATRNLFDRLAPHRRDRLFVGFDFPIGLPSAYASKTGFSGFKHALMAFGKGEWSDWFSVCGRAEEISLRRPFYPYAPGGRGRTSRKHLAQALKVDGYDYLLRACERKSDGHNAACALFWTLGGNQVGKAAIAGWQEVIQPALDRDEIGLWPFDGDLDSLVKSKRHVIAETYPAQAYTSIGIPRTQRWSKRKQSGRRCVSTYALDWMAANAVKANPEIERQIIDGFGDKSDGEDRFDAFVGLLGMIGALLNLPDESAPSSRDVRRWEGWILGQPSELS